MSADAQRAFRDELIRHGLLIPMGVDGLYGRGAAYERAVEGVDHAITMAGQAEKPEIMRFPPGIGLGQLEKSGYLRSFPQLAGTVHSFLGSERKHRALLEALTAGKDGTVPQSPTAIAVTPAACYSVYPAIAARGPLPADGVLVDVAAYCFRHEPSIDPARMQMFRMREYVRIGTPDQAFAFRQSWIERGQALFGSLGLPLKVEVANDPFFGRVGKLLAANQREDALKFEVLVPITSDDQPTALTSFNYHRDQFGQTWGMTTASGEVAHSACIGIGMDRIVLALFRHHGVAIERWPTDVRAVLGLS